MKGPLAYMLTSRKNVTKTPAQVSMQEFFVVFSLFFFLISWLYKLKDLVVGFITFHNSSDKFITL